MQSDLTKTTVYEYWIAIPNHPEEVRVRVPADSEDEAESMYNAFISHIFAEAQKALLGKEKLDQIVAAFQPADKPKARKKPKRSDDGQTKEEEILSCLKVTNSTKNIAQRLKTKTSNISQALGRLKRKGLVRKEGYGRWVLADSESSPRKPETKPKKRKYYGMVNPQSDNEYMDHVKDEIEQETVDSLCVCCQQAERIIGSDLCRNCTAGTRNGRGEA